MNTKQRMQYLHRNRNQKKQQEGKNSPGREKEEADAKRPGTGKADPG